MDGINPTLAFAVLFFGLSGNGRDAADDPPMEVEVEAQSGCTVLMIAGDFAQPPIETWAEAFWNSGANALALPEVIEPKWTGSAFPESDGTELDDVAPVAVASADPVMRQAVPTGMNGITADPESGPCGQER
jgi:hypothetical protein